MEAPDFARVQFLVQPDAYSAWEVLMPDPAGTASLDVALAEYGDVRLVAAYVLERVCQDARLKATEVTAQVKRIKVGPIELEKVVKEGNDLSVKADQWCARAAALRRQVDEEVRAARRNRSVIVPVEASI